MLLCLLLSVLEIFYKLKKKLPNSKLRQPIMGFYLWVM